MQHLQCNKDLQHSMINARQVPQTRLQCEAGAREEQLLPAQVDASPDRVPCGVGLGIVVQAHHVQLLAIRGAVAIAVGFPPAVHIQQAQVCCCWHKG